MIGTQRFVATLDLSLGTTQPAIEYDPEQVGRSPRVDHGPIVWPATRLGTCAQLELDPGRRNFGGTPCAISSCRGVGVACQGLRELAPRKGGDVLGRELGEGPVLADPTYVVAGVSGSRPDAARARRYDGYGYFITAAFTDYLLPTATECHRPRSAMSRASRSMRSRMHSPLPLAPNRVLDRSTQACA
jgi:hypothetical protein